MFGHQADDSTLRRQLRESRLAAYLAATGVAATALTTEADAAIVANTATQAFGINGEVNIDFNLDGQIDYQVDHDRFSLAGNNLDYLQIDKNDVNSETNPLPTNILAAFPGNGTPLNDTFASAYVNSSLGAYPSALTAGSPIGPDSSFDWQEGDNFDSSGKTIRANRLIDEDQTQIDQQVGGLTPSQVYVPTDGPNFLGLGGEVRYLGLKMDFNNANQVHFGWIGIRIDNEANATGAVVGYAYENTPGAVIAAGETGPFVANADYDDDGDVDGNDFLVWQRQLGSTVTAGTGADGNGDGMVNGLDLSLWRGNFGSATAAGEISAATVPEPGSLLIAGLGGALLACCFVVKRGRRKLAPVLIRR